MPKSPKAGQLRVLSHVQILAGSDRKRRYLSEFQSAFLLSWGSASLYVSELFVILFCKLFVSFAHFSVGLFIFFLLIYGNIFLYQENELFVHDKSCGYFPPVCHLVASFCLWVFFYPHAQFLCGWRHQSVLRLSGVSVVLRKYLANTSLCQVYIFLNHCDFF